MWTWEASARIRNTAEAAQKGREREKERERLTRERDSLRTREQPSLCCISQSSCYPQCLHVPSANRSNRVDDSILTYALVFSAYVPLNGSTPLVGSSALEPLPVCLRRRASWFAIGYVSVCASSTLEACSVCLPLSSSMVCDRLRHCPCTFHSGDVFRYIYT
ncbi:unnamed protein product [Rangifer tarandus platyrhynchus]|uniref:Uncharacterized protein n=1 Tax=Rangifer tarandus platyrhynchus TaxID=3082113 RepID=A0ABN8XIT3_RANTA|nr:unnamed protein product [Rangifer tarandus platyrhynchus]